MAVRLYQDLGDAEGVGKAHLARAYVRYEAGHGGGFDDAKEACRLIPIESPFKSIARTNFVFYLSKQPGRLREAAAEITKLRASYAGEWGHSLELAFIDWIEAGISAGLAAQEKGLTWERRAQRGKARDLYADALEFFEKKEILSLEVDAIRTDFAAFEAVESREHAERLLDFPTGQAELRPLVATARRSLSAPEAEFWAAMRALRDATVAMGADPPLVPYGQVAA